MHTMPTYRRGRDRYSETGDRGGFAGICSVILIVMLLFVPPLVVISMETAHYQLITSLLEVFTSKISTPTSNSKSGDIVHLHATLGESRNNNNNNLVQDFDMNVGVSNALRLHRKTEYCQWQELQSQTCQSCTRQIRAKDGSTQTETYDCHCVTSYNYIKAWRSHRIPSFLFDQPAVHNNPQRDPMPSQWITAPKVTVDNVHDGHSFVVLDQSVLQNTRAKWRRVDWTLHGQATKPPWYSPVQWGWWKDTTRYEPIQNLRDTIISPAATIDNFVYVGQGGYFFSPYIASKSGQLFKYFMEYMEGSLFDWQLGDLMPSCTAGDVRFSYRVQDPSSISVIAQVANRVDGLSSSAAPVLTSISTTQKTIGLVHEGFKSIDEMFQAEERASWWTTVMPRVFLLLPWSAAICNLVGALFGFKNGDSPNSSYLSKALGTASVWLGFMGGVWICVWGKSVDSIFCLVGSAALGFLWMERSRLGRIADNGGFQAVWCMIGRWARVPPSWRVEKSYGDGSEEKKYL